MNNLDIYTAGTDRLLKPRIKPCRCERLHFPHRREVKCEVFEESGDDIQSMLDDDRFNAEFNKIFS